MNDLTLAERDVLAERRRHVNGEGWTPEHDDTHRRGEMAAAAACYAMPDNSREYFDYMGKAAIPKPRGWPWDISWWKPKDRRYDLVRAAALIIAEIERLDRLRPGATP